MTILLSWVAFFYDFTETEPKTVNADGPTAELHRRFFAPATHQRHILLNPDEDDPRAELLLNYLQRQHRGRAIELRHLPIPDVFDYRILKAACEALLSALTAEGGTHFDVLFSNGTTPMRTVWVLLKLEGRYNIRLIQGKERRMRDVDAEPHPFSEILLDTSIFPHRLQAIEATPTPPDILITPTLARVYSLADRVAPVESLPVLIRGESGTGKEFLARHVHQRSARHQQPFIAVNTATIGDDLLESRFFGYLKGAFTGANHDTPGFFQQAEGGTLFLDEIGDISPAMQVALLRVLQEQEINPVGSTTSRKINVRIIAATHQPLEERCAQGSFRWDLYYRLSVATLDLPPLRDYPLAERRLLRSHHTALIARQYPMTLTLSPTVSAWFDAYSFPGNLRQAFNLLLHLALFAEGPATMDDIARAMRRRVEDTDQTLAAAEMRHIRYIYHQCAQNLSQTAKTLGISLNTLKTKLRTEEAINS